MTDNLIPYNYLAENTNKKTCLLKTIIKKVGSEGELNPGLPRERPETKPLCHKGIHISIGYNKCISTYV